MVELLEIKIDFDKLENAIAYLNTLEKGTGYDIYCTSDFINHSRGKMYKKTNEFYKKLMAVEDAMIEIIEGTKQALTNAGIEFEKAEDEIINIFNQGMNIGLTNAGAEFEKAGIETMNSFNQGMGIGELNYANKEGF